MAQPTATPSASPSAAASTTSTTYAKATGNAGQRAPTLLPGFETVSAMCGLPFAAVTRGIEESAVTRSCYGVEGGAPVRNTTLSLQFGLRSRLVIVRGLPQLFVQNSLKGTSQ